MANGTVHYVYMIGLADVAWTYLRHHFTLIHLVIIFHILCILSLKVAIFTTLANIAAYSNALWAIHTKYKRVWVQSMWSKIKRTVRSIIVINLLIKPKLARQLVLSTHAAVSISSCTIQNLILIKRWRSVMVVWLSTGNWQNVVLWLSHFAHLLRKQWRSTQIREMLNVVSTSFLAYFLVIISE